ncbi:Metallo-dependent phosphatase-like protein [Phialemonium atrogriseum]|uniref:Metallo-dependent phosphatase-like protein n=1 Tax=Phialemonium atrogriseum TaxID=1093897 RepID=A0AAJ0C106_9PEZI|nr:Metallo-dependent phosphatase-like protein [Phialemonium atrogriseum]KAK1768158.1 Metallo-dependent phosphatase-like protein [Phialemonium atrogriseum]
MMFGQRSTALDALLHRPRPSALQQFLRAPCSFLARKIYTHRRPIPAAPPANAISVVCISDTHNSQPHLPDGDVLIHAGDLTQSGSPEELHAALAWLAAQPHPHKIVVAGNHDLLLDPQRDFDGGQAAARALLDWGDVVYLRDSAATVVCANGRRLRVYGSPRSARHGNWAFQYPREEDVWAGVVPGGVDVLVTHGPPRAHLDSLGLGCRHLLRELWRVQPALHVFGHVHEGYGREWLLFDGLQDAYERTIIAGGGVWNLARVLHEFVRGLFWPATEARCLLVNPSMVGGLRDDERRRPIKVDI